ncbi:hypothetical protein [Caldifermentibacillus hisashii]|uniref:hypothetical protein n=1 Tax=Caldifermentibacillus hisashii TaxID=996558 RepID=UPI0022B9733B|nr:hypothetical protein [Caldifermentibacillus hisashii]
MKENNEKKVKGFRLPQDSIDFVNELIKKSGKEDAEWFEDILHQLATNELIVDKEGVPANLRIHFNSDITALKDATNSIINLFINQMNRIAVEKNNWEQYTKEKEQAHVEKENVFKENIAALEQEIQERDQIIRDVENTITQLRDKVEGFDKLEVQLRKEIQRLEDEKDNLAYELEQVKEQAVLERENYNREIQELKQQYKEQKSELNQRIVDLLEQIKELEPLYDENNSLQMKIKEQQIEFKQKQNDFELTLTRTIEQAELDKEKSLMSRERELREVFYEESKHTMKELYERIESLQLEISSLKTENNTLKMELNQLKK